MSKLSITNQRFFFRRTEQGIGEKVSDWESRLRKQAEFCKFSCVDEQIFDQIVEKTNCNELKREAFRMEMSLSELLDVADKIEKGCYCNRCGSGNHRYDDPKCLALTHKCEICLLYGHYSSKCTKSQLKREWQWPSTSDENGYEKRVKNTQNDTVKEESTNKRRKKPSIDIAKLRENIQKWIEPNITNNKMTLGEKSRKWLEEIKKEVDQYSLVAYSPSQSPPILIPDYTEEIKLVKRQKIDEISISDAASESSSSTSSVRFVDFATTINIPNRREKKISCTIGDVPSVLTISDDYMVNVISKKFFDTHKIKCCIHGNKDVTINERKYTGSLETRIERNGKHLTADFYFSDEIKEEKCIITSHIAKKLG